MLSGSLPATAPLDHAYEHSDSDQAGAGAGGGGGRAAEYSRRSVDAAFFADGEDLDRRLKAVEGKLSQAAAAPRSAAATR